MAAARSVRSSSLSPILEHTTSHAQTRKLRASCDACAISKVKCTKEMPVCSRCAKRGATCKYLATKKAGRSSRADSQTSNMLQDRQQNDTLIASKPSLPLSTSPPTPLPNSPTPNTPLSIEELVIPDSYSSTSIPALTYSDGELDEYLACFITETLSDGNDQGLFSQNASHSCDDLLSSSQEETIFLFTSEDKFPVVDHIISDMEPPYESSTWTSEPCPQPPPSSSSCCCLSTTLSLLKQLSPNSASSCTRSSELSLEDETLRVPTIDFVVAQNAQVIDSVRSMLQCPCSQDGYLLTTISLVVLKVLAWYAAAARQSPTLASPTKIGVYSIESGSDSHRMAAQVVLSELHRSQGLVNLFSQRLKRPAQGRLTSPSAVVDSVTRRKSSDDSDFDRSNTIDSPFSADMLERLELELRQQLRAVWQETVDVLQRS